MGPRPAGEATAAIIHRRSATGGVRATGGRAGSGTVRDSRRGTLAGVRRARRSRAFGLTARRRIAAAARAELSTRVGEESGVRGAAAGRKTRTERRSIRVRLLGRVEDTRLAADVVGAAGLGGAGSIFSFEGQHRPRRSAGVAARRASRGRGAVFERFRRRLHAAGLVGASNVLDASLGRGVFQR